MKNEDLNDITFFIGNGINNFSEGISWSKLLSQLAYRYDIKIDLSSNIPLSIIYEQIIFKTGYSFIKERNKIKKIVQTQLLSTKPNRYHQQLINSPYIKNIITTNYDYNLEKALGLSEEILKVLAKKSKERTFSLYRHNLLSNGKNIWHIHGELFKLESILLGYEHYSNHLEKVRRLAVWKERNETHKHNWIDIFYQTPIIFFGFGLSFSEIDIWWLLTYRKRELLNKNRKKSKNPISLLITRKQYNDNKTFYDTIKSFDIILIIYYSSNYNDFYNEVFNEIDNLKLFERIEVLARKQKLNSLWK